MKAKLLQTVLLIVLSSTLCIDCSPAPDTTSEHQAVTVSILPQVEFVKGICADKFVVTAMIPPGANPHIYEPLPSQIKKLGMTKLYAKVGSGIEFEIAWMDKLIAANRNMHIVDCSQDVKLLQLSKENQGHAGTFDPHIWLSPSNAKKMLHNIYDGILIIDPANKEFYTFNLNLYEEKLNQLDKEISNLFATLKRKEFITYHPAFAYFARDYGLQMMAIEEEGKEPSASDIAKIIDLAIQHNLKIVIVSPQFNAQSANLIAAQIQGKVIFIDHLAEGYIENLRYLAQSIAQNG